VVPLAENFRFYETYGNYMEKAANGLIVGYEQAKMIVAEGKICAALLDAPMSLEKIRVLIKTTGFTDLVHADITLKAHGDYEVARGDKKSMLLDGEELQLEFSGEFPDEDRVILTPSSSDSRIEVCSIERNYGTPLYAGRMEVAKESGGLLLINELDLETYLYSVVPSEMPASYEMEALKAQAVCARSYAYRQIMANGYANYGAHVDDSVSYQVYNNLQTHENVIRAVNETAGLVLKFGEEVATTYYFSTSCGYTTNETIWKNGLEENSYISGKLLNDSMERLNLRDEDAFREFILNENYETYDSGEAWYRWDMTVPVEHITETIGSMENIGNVTDIKVIERNDGGVVHRVQVVGSEGTLELTYEHAIRVALNGKDQIIKRTYGKDANGGSMLPSGFFVIDKVEEEGAVKGFRFRGGGFGHGAGMSQNGANHMAEAGKNYEEILGLFYEGTSLTTI
jgi:stage II sporulation protein D